MIGAVIAGGRGRRLGGAKPTAELDGRPLASYAVAALQAVCEQVVIVAKRDTALPDLGVPVWHDAGADFHPRHGLVTALRGAEGAGVLALAVDLPRIGPNHLRALLEAGAPAVARDPEGRLQPLCGVYPPEALDAFEAAPPDEPLTRTVQRLQPVAVDLPAPALRNVNTPEDLASA